jgi:hypothetical protein
MLNRLLPSSLSNQGIAPIVALVLFVPILAMKTLIGLGIADLNPFARAADILQNVDAIPLDSFPAAAREAVVSSAKAWGVAMLALCGLLWVVVARYRSALPLAILTLLVEQLLRTGHAVPRTLERLFGGEEVSAGSLVNLGMTGVLVLAFVIALLPGRRAT